MTLVRRLLALAGLRRARVALSIALGALAVGFGVALLTAAGYLISRAAEQPPILALTTIIVVVRFLALARPLARYLERLASHDLALRALGRIRAAVYERIEPLAPAELDAFRRGDLVSRMVGDVDALQGVYLRGLVPPAVALIVAVACVVATALVLPAAAIVLAVGLALAGLMVPLLAARLARHWERDRRLRAGSSRPSSSSSCAVRRSSSPSAGRRTRSRASATRTASSFAWVAAMHSSPASPMR